MELISKSFKVLILSPWVGFSTDGLAVSYRSSVDVIEGEDDVNCQSLEEIVQLTNVNDWIDDRSWETYQNYKRLVMDKLKRGSSSIDEIESEDNANHPSFKKTLWEQAGGGNKKGNMYGFGYITSLMIGTSSCGFQRPDPEKQILKERIEELEKKNALEKAENEAMCKRLAAIEQFLNIGKG